MIIKIRIRLIPYQHINLYNFFQLLFKFLFDTSIEKKYIRKFSIYHFSGYIFSEQISITKVRKDTNKRAIGKLVCPQMFFKHCYSVYCHHLEYKSMIFASFIAVSSFYTVSQPIDKRGMYEIKKNVWFKQWNRYSLVRSITKVWYMYTYSSLECLAFMIYFFFY